MSSTVAKVGLGANVAASEVLEDVAELAWHMRHSPSGKLMTCACSPDSNSRSASGLPKALIQQIANGTDVILLSRVQGKVISPDGSASNASVNDHQSFS
jgi:hypothetical protein